MTEGNNKRYNGKVENTTTLASTGKMTHEEINFVVDVWTEEHFMSHLVIIWCAYLCSFSAIYFAILFANLLSF